MMNQTDDWMSVGMWTWWITGTLLVVLLVLAINKLSKKQLLQMHGKL